MTRERRPIRRWSAGHESTRGPYWEAMFYPATATRWLEWKLASVGANIARQLWRTREYRRRTYESVFGADPSSWPSQHPGVVLDRDAAGCLRCHWFVQTGPSRVLTLARRHEKEQER